MNTLDEIGRQFYSRFDNIASKCLPRPSFCMRIFLVYVYLLKPRNYTVRLTIKHHSVCYLFILHRNVKDTFYSLKGLHIWTDDENRFCWVSSTFSRATLYPYVFLSLGYKMRRLRPFLSSPKLTRKVPSTVWQSENYTEISKLSATYITF